MNEYYDLVPVIIPPIYVDGVWQGPESIVLIHSPKGKPGKLVWQKGYTGNKYTGEWGDERKYHPAKLEVLEVVREGELLPRSWHLPGSRLSRTIVEKVLDEVLEAFGVSCIAVNAQEVMEAYRSKKTIVLKEWK